jgi:hypothetical protein
VFVNLNFGHGGKPFPDARGFFNEAGGVFDLSTGDPLKILAGRIVAVSDDGTLVYCAARSGILRSFHSLRLATWIAANDWVTACFRLQEVAST